MRIKNKDLPKYFSDFNKYGRKSVFLPDQLLTNLVGFPEIIPGDIDLRHNAITSLLGCPDLIGGTLYLEDNKLTTLDYLPKKVLKISIIHNHILDFSKIVNVEFTATLTKLQCSYCENSALLPLLYVSNQLVLIDNTGQQFLFLITLIGQYTEYNKANIIALQTDLINNGYEKNAIWTPV